MTFLFNGISRNPFNNIKFLNQFKNINAVRRNLISHITLGNDDYLLTRYNISQQYVGLPSNYKDHIRKCVDNSDLKIFTKDLNDIIHLAEDQDLDLVLKMIKKIKVQKGFNHMHFIRIAPDIMKLFHFLNAPLEGLKVHDELKMFNCPPLTHLILLDLLYKNGMFNKISTFFEDTKSKLYEDPINRDIGVILVLASCYVSNTSESYEYGMNLWSDIRNLDRVPARAAVLMAGLALNQGVPDVALEILSEENVLSSPEYINIKVMALLDMELIHDALGYFETTVIYDLPQLRQTDILSREVIRKLDEAVHNTGDIDLKNQFKNIMMVLQIKKFTTSNSVRDLLLMPMVYPEDTGKIKYALEDE